MIYILPIFSVLIGFIIALVIKPSNTVGLKLLLSFSGAYLLSITVLEFLPEIYSQEEKLVGIFIMIGILLQIILEFFSKGAEHGHLHRDPNSSSFPLLLLISLCVHSLLEGFPLNGREHLLHGVVLHKIPVAIILATFLLQSKIKKPKIVLFLLIFAAMTPVGSWLSKTLTTLETFEVYVNAVVVGIFLHISTTILFEASSNHTFNSSKLAVIIAGILLAYFI